MSTWIDIIVYAALIVAVWTWLPPQISRLTIAIVADRNPDWIASHPAAERRLPASRWFRRVCLTWGALSLTALILLQTDSVSGLLPFLDTSPKWEALKDLNSTLLIVGLVFAAAWCILSYRRLHAAVPIASRRQASLERRSLGNYAPPALLYTVYAVIAFHLATWVAVGVIGRYAAPSFIGELAFQFVTSGVCLLLLVSVVRRRPGAFDRIYGPAYRRSEVRLAVGAQLLPLGNGIVRLYEHLAGPAPEQLNRLLHLGLVLLIVGLVVAVAVRSRRAGPSRTAGWRRSATSLGAIALVGTVATMQAPPLQTTPPRVCSPDRIGNHQKRPAAVRAGDRPACGRNLRSSQRQFFYKAVNAQLTFEVDDAGRTLAVVLNRNGAEQRARRVE